MINGNTHLYQEAIMNCRNDKCETTNNKSPA